MHPAIIHSTLHLPPSYVEALYPLMDCVPDPCLGVSFHNQLRLLVKAEWPDYVRLGREIHELLASGPGAVVVRYFPKNLDERLRDFVYLSLALYVGIPMTHDEERVIWEISKRFHECVVPTYSETDEEAPLHTDGAYKERPPQVIGNLVVHRADEGGEMFFADSEDICRDLKKTSDGRQCLQLLQQSFPIRLPSSYVENDKARWIEAVPLSLDPVRVRFRPDVILKGLEMIGEPETSDRTRAVRYFGDYLKTADRFQLGPEEGVLLFLDNRRILHGRRAFTGPRHLRRIWINCFDNG